MEFVCGCLVLGPGRRRLLALTRKKRVVTVPGQRWHRLGSEGAVVAHRQSGAQTSWRPGQTFASPGLVPASSCVRGGPVQPSWLPSVFSLES